MDYTFDCFNEDIEKIYWQIVALNVKYDYIVGLVRGGAIPAVVLSHKFDHEPEVVMLHWSHNAETQEHNAWLPGEIRKGKKVLIIDDIVDSGRSIKEVLADWEVTPDQVDIAALIYNTSQDVVVQFCGRTIDRDTDVDWINFWWEM